MRLAIAVWNERVSPVFDTAGRLILVDMENGVEQGRHVEIIPEASMMQRARRLTDLGVSVLICGAISRPLATLLSTSGIRVLPWTAGAVHDVLDVYLKGRLPDPRWLMPGCRVRGQGRRSSRGWCRRRGS